jgi:hypothetical protein
MIYVADGLEINYLSPDEIHDWQPYREIPPANQRNEPFIQRLQDAKSYLKQFEMLSQAIMAQHTRLSLTK